MKILYLADASSLHTKKLVEYSYNNKGPKYFRIEKGIIQNINKGKCNISTGIKTIFKNTNSNFVILSTGYMSSVCYEMIKLFDKPIRPTIIDIFRLRPLNKEKIIKMCKDKNVIIVEENIESGSMSEKILSLLKMANHNKKCFPINLEDSFYFEFGSREYLHKRFNLDKESLYNRINLFIKGDKK